jgi:hypothetical protein
MHTRTNTISPQERARRKGILFDYFSVSIYETQSELLVHTRINHDNAVRFGRTARGMIRYGKPDAHRILELAIEDRAHAHSILARAEELPVRTPEDADALNEIRRICKRTLALVPSR